MIKVLDARASAAVQSVITRLTELNNGQDVALDCLSFDAVGEFCAALGFAADRNWATLSIDEIAPVDPRTGAAVVPADEASTLLRAVATMLKRGWIDPHQDTSLEEHLVNDFLPEGTFLKAPTYGHLWEWQYALQVELEHGRTRGTNVTNNHPLLTVMVVLAHLTEDPIYYARLWVMETEGEILGLQLKKAPHADVLEKLAELARARQHLDQRIFGKLQLA